jgi:uncharacterized membrane protein YkoI
MNRRSVSTFLLTGLLTGALVAQLGLSGVRADSEEHGEYEEEDHDAARAAVQRGEAMPLAKVIAAISAELPGEIVEIEFEREHGRWIYELKVIDQTGRLHEIYVDAATARILPYRDD